jgi:hypothetical protein
LYGQSVGFSELANEFQHLLQREVGQLGNILIGNGDQDNAKLDHFLVDGKAYPWLCILIIMKNPETTPNIREDSWKRYWASDRRIHRNPVKSVPKYWMPEDFPIARK